MKARVISYDLAHCQALEDILNEWLEDTGDIRIDHCVTLGNAGPERAAGALVVFYIEPDDEAHSRAPEEPEAVICGQCKKRPAIKDKKICKKCKEYQDKYRARRREEKKKSRYP